MPPTTDDDREHDAEQRDQQRGGGDPHGGCGRGAQQGEHEQRADDLDRHAVDEPEQRP